MQNGNTNLSKMLCEMCGIEPFYKCTYSGDICPYKYKGDLSTHCSKQEVPEECEVRRQIDYIDFTEPENFVKLIELKVDQYSDGLFWDLPPIPLWSNGVREAFLFTLLECLPDMKIIHKNKIIKAIKETQWKI